MFKIDYAILRMIRFFEALLHVFRWLCYEWRIQPFLLDLDLNLERDLRRLLLKKLTRNTV